MYNRYIPQSDGTYKKRIVPEPSRPAPIEPPQTNSVFTEKEAATESICKPPERPRSKPMPRPRDPGSRHPQKENSASSFLKNLLPKNLDTGDLLIIVLMLLLSDDCPEEQNSALLTLALYLFM